MTYLAKEVNEDADAPHFIDSLVEPPAVPEGGDCLVNHLEGGGGMEQGGRDHLSWQHFTQRTHRGRHIEADGGGRGG